VVSDANILPVSLQNVVVMPWRVWWHHVSSVPYSSSSSSSDLARNRINRMRH